MAFQAKIMKKDLTLKMHYSNCAGFNADFDGDEMNLHLLQTYQARADGLQLALSDKQFILPTNSNPVRGLIQDFVFSSVFITQKNRFFDKETFT